MNLRELEYLVAVEEEKHFNKAAERCFVSQPTLSGQLKKLEHELGVMLVERSTRHVVMTEVGRIIATRARQVLSDIREIRDIAGTYHDPMAGELHVGLIPTVAPYLLPTIMPVLNQSYPSLKLWLHEYQTSVLLDKLKRAELDLLILALPVDTNEFSQLELFKEAFELAIPVDQAASMPQLITLDHLANQEMLLLEEGHCLRGQALDVCFMAGARENTGFHASSMETLRHMVGEGMGMTLIPELAVPVKHIPQDAVHYIPFKSPKPSRQIGLLYRKGSYRESAFIQIQGVIQSAIKQRIKPE